jgi:predicted GNAT family N-acyltransferase
MAVEPKHQGRHAGITLAQWAIDLSEQTGVPVYLEASPKLYKWYEKLGFLRLKEEVVHHAVDLGTKNDVAIPLMVKLPSKGCDFDTSLLRD